jgi:hypothetical protein
MKQANKSSSFTIVDLPSEENRKGPFEDRADTAGFSSPNDLSEPVLE